ncbi:MAG TPA: hypothetical protein PLC99_06530 [Verrucomicrobiota bacterium]|nr:hypothetical protein [Verrucomicrobiota bacterium]
MRMCCNGTRKGAWKYLLFANTGLFLFNLAGLPAPKRGEDL